MCKKCFYVSADFALEFTDRKIIFHWLENVKIIVYQQIKNNKLKNSHQNKFKKNLR